MCLIQWPLPELKVTTSVESKIFWLHFLTHYSIDQDKILGSVAAIEVGYPDMSFERDLNVLREILLMCLIWWLCWLNPLSCECCILGCQAQIFCIPPELGFEGNTNGSYLLPCLMAEWSGLQEMWTWWCLVRFSTGALSWGFFLCVFFPILFRMLFSCNSHCEAKGGGLPVLCQLTMGILVLVVSSSSAVKVWFLLVSKKSFGFFVR